MITGKKFSFREATAGGCKPTRDEGEKTPGERGRERVWRLIPSAQTDEGQCGRVCVCVYREGKREGGGGCEQSVESLKVCVTE